MPDPEFGCAASQSPFRNFAGREAQVLQNTQFRIWQTAGNHQGPEQKQSEYIMENPVNMDDFLGGYPYFWKPPKNAA